MIPFKDRFDLLIAKVADMEDAVREKRGAKTPRVGNEPPTMESCVF